MGYKYLRVKNFLRKKPKDFFNPNNLTEEDFAQGIVFKAKFVGCLEIEKPSSRVEIVAAMRRVRLESRRKKVKKRSVTLRLSLEGVEVALAGKKKFLIGNIVSRHSISRIFYVSHDSQDLKVFSYITSDEESKIFHCSVFKSIRKTQAIEVVKTIGRAFDVCHKIEDNSSNNNDTLVNKVNNKNDETRMSTLTPTGLNKLCEEKSQNVSIYQQESQHLQLKHQMQQAGLFYTPEYFSSITLPRDNKSHYNATENFDIIKMPENTPNFSFFQSDSLKSADKYKISQNNRPLSSSFAMPSPIVTQIPTSLDQLNLLTPNKNNFAPIKNQYSMVANSQIESFQHFQLQQQMQLQQQQLQLLTYQIQEIKSMIEAESAKRIDFQVQMESHFQQQYALLRQLIPKRTSFISNSINNNENNFSSSDYIVNTPIKSANEYFNKRNSANDSFMLNSPNYTKNREYNNSFVAYDKMSRSFNNGTPHRITNEKINDNSIQLLDNAHIKGYHIDDNLHDFKELLPKNKQEKDFFEILQRYNSICGNNKNMSNDKKRGSSVNNQYNYAFPANNTTFNPSYFDEIKSSPNTNRTSLINENLKRNCHKHVLFDAENSKRNSLNSQNEESSLNNNSGSVQNNLRADTPNNNCKVFVKDSNKLGKVDIDKIQFLCGKTPKNVQENCIDESKIKYPEKENVVNNEVKLSYKAKEINSPDSGHEDSMSNGTISCFIKEDWWEGNKINNKNKNASDQVMERHSTEK